MQDCLFCKMIRGEIPVTKVYEDDDMMIIRDIDPKAKNHFLLFLKEHFRLLADMTPEQAEKLGRALGKIPELSGLLELDGGYRLVINQGDNAGQTVPHVHVLILSGQKMNWQPA